MKIAVLDDWAGTAADMADWGQLRAEVQFFRDPVPTGQLAAVLRPFDVVCVMRERTPLPGDLLSKLPNLRLIVTSGARNLSIDLAAAAARDIVVSGTRSRKTTTAELTLALILAQGRALAANGAALGQGGFQAVIGRDLADLRVGLVGLGQVGGQVARLLLAFGARVSGWSPNLTDTRAAELGVTRAPDLMALAAMSDVISLHLVLSDRTRGIIDARVLEALPKDALLVNTARAGLLDRDALFGWLDRNPKGQAAIDVFETEPLTADDPWRQAAARFGPRLLLTPHLGYATAATWRLFHAEMVEAIAAWAAGAPIRQLQPDPVGNGQTTA